MAEKGKISTFVFLDIEATGLPSPGRYPSITEICLVAVHRLSLLDKSQPRVLNKLNICVNPLKAISSAASNITGLYNDNLEHQKDFDDGMVELLSTFLRRLDPPVCLLAHNGKRFDFGILRSELASIDRSLSDTILCADTLEAFMALDGLTLKELKRQPIIRQDDLSSLDTSKTTPSTRCHFSPNVTSENTRKVNLCDFVSKQNNGPQPVVPVRDISEVENVKRKLFASSGDQDEFKNEPKRQRPNSEFLISGEKSEIDKVKRRLFCDEGEDIAVEASTSDSVNLQKDLTPTNGKFLESRSDHDQSIVTENTEESTTATVAEADLSNSAEFGQAPSVTSVNSNHSASAHTPDNTQNLQCPRKSPNKPLFPTPKSSEKARLSYSLRELHKRIVSEFPKDSHLAEADCMSLLNIVHKKSPDLLDWFDRNAIPLNVIEYMYTPKKRKCLEAGVFPYQSNC